MEATSKICTKCREEKLLAAFSKNSGSQDGLTPACKDCNSESNKEWRAKNPDFKTKRKPSIWFPPMTENSKLCTKCWRLKDFSAFRKAKGGRFGLRADCKECQADQRREHFKNPEVRAAFNAWQKDWAVKNPDLIKKSKKRDYEKNKEARTATQNLWKQENKDKINSYSQKRKAKKLHNGYESYERIHVFVRDCWTCQICFELVDDTLQYPDPYSKSIDHIIPVVRGGPDTFDNVQLAHLVCNNRKKAKMPEEVVLWRP